MQPLLAILDYLEGKKTVILAILAPIIAYAVAIHGISPELGALLQTIISVLAGGAAYGTVKLAGVPRQNK